MQKLIDLEVRRFFCCPESYASFEPDGGADLPVGYFRLGPDVICFGRSSAGCSPTIEGSLGFDSWPESHTAGDGLKLPFVPSEIANNLRFERYVGQTSQNSLRGAADWWKRKAYYAVRPLLGVSVRKHLQRRALRGWSTIQFPAWPIDRTADKVLERCLALSIRAHGVARMPFIWFWPDGNKSCCIMTHDVEEAEGVRACDAVMDFDSSVGLSASFQFVPEQRYNTPPAVLDRVRRRGFEVNVHDLNHDGHLYDDREEFLRRAEKINRYVKEFQADGFRSAVLYRNLTWYDAFEFSYDMSVPNVAHLDPQRGGCCTIMPFVVNDIVELPLTTIQDYSLFNILSDYSIDLWKRQADEIISNHGLLSFNIHPDYLREQAAQETYNVLLKYLAGRRERDRIYFALPGEVARWWRQRSEMTLVYQSGGWKIQGPGSERATIAYASVDGAGLTYSFE